MKNIEVKEKLVWFDFKKGRLLRFAGIFLPIALYFYLDNKYSLNLEQQQLFFGLYLLLHGLWTYFSKTFPLFAKTGVTMSTIIIKEKAAKVLSGLLILAGLIFLLISLN